MSSLQHAQMFKKLKVELVIFEPVRFLPDSMWPCRTVCLRRVQSVGDFSVSMLASWRLLSVHVGKLATSQCPCWQVDDFSVSMLASWRLLSVHVL